MSTCLACWFGWACALHAVELPPKPEYPPPKFEAGRCLWLECDVTLKDNNTSKRAAHWRTHTGEKPFKCQFPSCDRAFSEIGNLRVHERSHTGSRPFKCHFCTKAFTTSGARITHERIHTKLRPYACRFPDCDKTFTQSGTRDCHERIHTGAKPYSCRFGECGKSFSTPGSRGAHERIHTGQRSHVCWICGHGSISASALGVHMLTHDEDAKSFWCTFSGCCAKFRTKVNLETHERIHTGEKPFECRFAGCNQRFTQDGNRKKHEKSQHTPEGQARQKRKENLAHKGFLKRDMTPDYGNSGKNPNQLVDFSCMGGTRAFIDFVFQFEHMLLLTELDEWGHSDRMLSCETKRMMDVVAALRIGGEKRPIVWLRINPDKYTIDGKVEKKPFEHRMDDAVKWAKGFKPIKDVTICYAYFSVCKFPGTKHRYPEILADSDFPKELKQCVMCLY